MSLNIITDIIKKGIDLFPKKEQDVESAEATTIEEISNETIQEEANYEEISLQDFSKIIINAATNEDGLVEFIEKNGVDAAFKALDKDGDGAIQANEVSSALGDVSSIQNFSITDLLKAVVKAVLNPTTTTEEILPEITPEVENTTEQTAPTIPPANIFSPPSGGTSSGGSSGGNGGGGGDTIGNGATTNPKTVAEYQSEISKKETDKSTVKQETIANIQTQEQKIAEIMTQENSGIPPEAKAEYEQQKATLETQIGEQATAIETQEGIIQDSNAKITSCDTAMGQIDGQISSLESQRTSASADDTDAKTRIQKKIDNLKEEKRRLDDEKKLAEKAKGLAETAKQTAEETKANLEKEQDGLLDAIIEKYKEAIPLEIKAALEAAKAEIQRLRADETTKLGALNTEIQTLKTEMAQLEQKEKTDKVIGENTEGLYDKNGKRIAPIIMPQTPEEWAKYGLTSESAISAFKKMQPKMQEASIDLIDYAMAHGYTVKVNSTYRSNAAQRKLHEKDPVLAATPGTSMHERGLAIDIRVLDGNGKKSKAAHKMLGDYWQSQGYNWLGTRKNNPEDWHYDMRNA